jgi:thymidylate synthase (FAD)
MGEVTMNVKLLAHTQVSGDFVSQLPEVIDSLYDNKRVDDGQLVALTAIRTCYSANKPSEIVAKEGEKYFGKQATDGEGGTEADRLFRMIFRSKHVSTVEHLSFTFSIEGVSRALLAQLTRHRAGFSFSVQSQRYVKFGSDDRSGGFDYVLPESISDDKAIKLSGEGEPLHVKTPIGIFYGAMDDLQLVYDKLRDAGVPAEDARAVLPNAAATNLVMTSNLRAILEFYSKRQKGRGAQGEIAELAERLREEVVRVEPWTEQFFEQA